MVKFPPVIDTPQAFAARFPVSRETLGRLVTYEAMLTRWQKTINLVAPSTVNHVWHRHFTDSAQIWTLGAKGPSHWLDLGSGAGFPGLVIAILAAERGDTHHTLIESDSRKAAFLREVARETGVAVDILCKRIEIPETRAKVGEVNCVTARALAPLPRLLGLAYPYFGPGTTGLFLKGREVRAEVEGAQAAWSFSFDLIESQSDADGRVLVVKSLQRNVCS